MGEAQRATGQPQQKQDGLTMQGCQGWGPYIPRMPVVPALSLVSQFGQQTIQPPYLQATLGGLFQGELVFQEGLTITLPARPGARPASLGEHPGY